VEQQAGQHLEDQLQHQVDAQQAAASAAAAAQQQQMHQQQPMAEEQQLYAQQQADAVSWLEVLQLSNMSTVARVHHHCTTTDNGTINAIYLHT